MCYEQYCCKLVSLRLILFACAFVLIGFAIVRLYISRALHLQGQNTMEALRREAKK